MLVSVCRMFLFFFQMRAIITGVMRKRRLNVEELAAVDLATFGHLICGLYPSEMKRLSPYNLRSASCFYWASSCTTFNYRCKKIWQKRVKLYNLLRLIENDQVCQRDGIKTKAYIKKAIKCIQCTLYAHMAIISNCIYCDDSFLRPNRITVLWFQRVVNVRFSPPLEMLTNRRLVHISHLHNWEHFAYLQRRIKCWILLLKLQYGCAVPAGNIAALHRTTDGGIDKLFVQTRGLRSGKCLGTRSFHWNWDIGRYSRT